MEASIWGWRLISASVEMLDRQKHVRDRQLKENRRITIKSTAAVRKNRVGIGGAPLGMTKRNGISRPDIKQKREEKEK